MAEDKIPSSPDSRRFKPAKVAGASPVMGGPQTGGYIEPAKNEIPTPKPPSEIPRTVKRDDK
ncbi:hypothetical protein KEJ45_04840 [Candidatus Bathyarchaeota archaeon]|nr:hypothetical protein [Candidatus Bathyarchaeota archaeon]